MKAARRESLEASPAQIPESGQTAITLKLAHRPMQGYAFPMENWIRTLSPDLFWDVDQASVDPALNARWLVERVLQRGRWDDWKTVSAHYGKACLSALRADLRVDAKSAHFLELYCES